MKRWPSWTLLGAAVVVLLAIAGGRAAGDRTIDERVDDIGRRLACPICDGESVFESRNETSAAIRVTIRQQVVAGATDDQVIEFVQRVNPDADLSLLPAATGVEATVWIVPVVVAVVAFTGVGLAFVRWRRYSAANHPGDADDDAALVEAALRASVSAEVDG